MFSFIHPITFLDSDLEATKLFMVSKRMCLKAPIFETLLEQKMKQIIQIERGASVYLKLLEIAELA